MESARLTVHVDDDGDPVVVVRINVRSLDEAGTEHVVDTIEQRIAAGDRLFVFDCRRLDHIGSALIAGLLKTIRHVSSPRAVALVVDEHSQHVLRICRLEGQLLAHLDMESALRAVRGES